ncbi:MAG: hypothetical protein FWD66_10645, partial [Paludibacter sp.]|nr:hypothetical protein [Paludibacter sp.]
FYIYTDHQGSILQLNNEAGAIVEQRVYDPWGRERTLGNWSNYLTDAGYRRTDRGYIGQEHLPQFGLINLNARLYDPVLGRFLSADPFVQAPGLSQNFNRYSYCMNNPLKFTDPSGEFWFVPIIIGAFINTAIQAHSGNLNNTGDYLKAIVVGGLAGAAGYGAGLVVSEAVGTIGILGGGLTGAAGGFAGGFVGGAGNAWANGSNFGQGLNAGLIGGGWGALTGGVIGAVSGGITAYNHGGNILTGGNSIFESVSTTPTDPTKPIVVGDGMEYSNEYAQDFSDAHLKPYSKGVTNLYADGTIPDGYEKVGDYVKNIETKEYVEGTTKYLGIGKGSNVYLYKSGFTSPAKLYVTMGHEYIHAGLNTTFLQGYKNTQEAYAYKWNYQQISAWSYVNTFYKSLADKYASYLLLETPDNISKLIPKLLLNEPVWYLLKK